MLLTMGTSSSFTLNSFFFLLCLILSSLLPTSLSFQISLGGGRIGIGIGIGGGSSPSSSTPKPSDFKSDYLYKSYFVIQQFKKTITCDPQGITNSWNGPDICGKYCGFYCEAPPGNDKNRVAVASVDFNGYTLRSNAFDIGIMREYIFIAESDRGSMKERAVSNPDTIFVYKKRMMLRVL